MNVDGLLYLALAVFIIGLISYWAGRINMAILKANNGRPYNPPPQMWIEKGEFKTAKGSQRVAWWVTFWREL